MTAVQPSPSTFTAGLPAFTIGSIARAIPSTSRGPRLTEGMVLAIEPMVNAGKPAVKVLGDGWTAVTKDKGLSAHFEHTVVVTEGGCRVLTLPDVAAEVVGAAG